MFDLKKGALALCLSGLAIASTAGTALASTASTASATQTTATVQTATKAGTLCGYQVYRTRHGLFVRSGPGTGFRILGALNNNERTMGSCTTIRDWVHLSNMYHHYAGVSKNARGWSFGFYLRNLSSSGLCGYQVYRAPSGLFVRTGPGTGFRVIGGLANGQHTTGSCTEDHGWVHLSNKFNHFSGSPNARGWSSGFYLRK